MPGKEELKKNSKTAILIVNGGKDPEQGNFLNVCLEKIRKHTKWEHYHLYIWNNNINDEWVSRYVSGFSNATLFQADPNEKLIHQHAVPLQRLYEEAASERLKYIVTMDTDAFPVRDGWLTDLIAPLENGAALSGVWRDEIDHGDAPPSKF